MISRSQEGSCRGRVGWLRALLATAALVAFACAAAQPRIVVSIAPYADLVQRLAGPEAVVETLLPVGASPHAFDPSPRDLARLEDADLVVVNGGLDEWVLRLVHAVDRDLPVFEVLETVEEDSVAGGVRQEGEDEGHEDEGEAGAPDPHDHGDVNPHVWLDPVLMARMVPALAEALDEADPEGAASRAAAAARLIRELRELHRDLEERLAPVAGAPFVPFHDAWPHFADRYRLDLILEIEPFPGREPSARALATAVEAVRASGARAIFNEAQLADRPARVLAAEAGVRVATLDPLGGTEGTRRYEELLRYNADRIVAALVGD